MGRNITIEKTAGPSDFSLGVVKAVIIFFNFRYVNIRGRTWMAASKSNEKGPDSM